ncbi:MAG TPA: PIG-L family deacetylase [Gemmatimonadaceae bacterium]|nr:PIG-L family deacetylase [Gemmatimonadaceae bacterium]
MRKARLLSLTARAHIAVVTLAALGAAVLMPQPGSAQGIVPSAASIRVQNAPERMRVLWIAAHPDDEDTNLIAWLARGRRVETAYMSLTRGDGGQNLIGNELGEALGVIRTEELLAARRIDGAHQYFARGYDFGFSKTADETRKHWPQDSLLNDVMTVMRAFRPHIVITTFSGTPRDGHGQHQISAIVARQAYDLAADTVRFPVKKFGAAWTPSKFYRLARFSPQDRTISINVGEYDPNLGLSYQEIAADSRSQHKSQGEGTLRRKGVQWDYLTREDSRIPAPPAKEEKSIFAGFDTTRLLVRDGRTAPPETRPALALEAVADRQALALGDTAKITMTLYNRGRVPVHIESGAIHFPPALLPDSSYQWTQLLVGGQITQPWWLAEARKSDLFALRITGTSEDERERQNWAHVTVQTGPQGTLLDVAAPIVYHYVDRVRGDVQRPLIVAPGISVTLDQATTMIRANVPSNQLIKTTLRSALSAPASVTVSLTLPRGLTADSLERTVLMAPGSTRTLAFRVRGTLPRGTHTVKAIASAKGVSYQSGYIPIEYPHINPQRIYRPSTMSVNAVDVALPTRLNVAYVPGVGDNVAPVLQQLGVPLTILDADDLPQTDLSRFTAIVVGPRAYQSSQSLQDNNEYLLSYVRNGGRLVVQYGQAEMQRPGIMPYPITLQQRAERVTDENAPVTFTDPQSPLLNAPNKITQDDFRGWVQERATYMPSTFDSHYRSMLAMNDPGEPPNRAAILAAPYGRGAYIYVPLALFRQLPAGVPGGARIFANLLGGNTIR